jgi:hypothetical protein
VQAGGPVSRRPHNPALPRASLRLHLAPARLNACSRPRRVPPWPGGRGARGQGQGQRRVQGRQARPRGAAVQAGGGDRGRGRARRGQRGARDADRGGSTRTCLSTASGPAACGQARPGLCRAAAARPIWQESPRTHPPPPHPTAPPLRPRPQIKELRRTAWLNLAAVELKRHEYKEARKHASKVGRRAAPRMQRRAAGAAQARLGL